jgi:hypothetical protein
VCRSELGENPNDEIRMTNQIRITKNGNDE